ncbi:MAG: aldo/keto reductase [Steroidobacteraceae bacterium]
MKYRTLGKSGIRVSRLGIGGSAFAGGVFHRDDRAARELLLEGIDRGINFIDTSDNYAMGRSETLIGEVLRNRRSDIVIATKGGARFTRMGRLGLAARPVLRPFRLVLKPARRWLNLQRDSHKHYVYDTSNLREAIEASLRRLGTDYIDVYQLYNPVPEAAGLSEAFEFLKRLKSEGKARCVGISVNHVDDARGIFKMWTPDTVQFPLSLLDQAARRGFLQASSRLGIGLIARSVLAQGILTDAEGHVMADQSSHLSVQTLRAWRAQRDKYRCLVRPDRTLAQAALCFVLQQPEVAVALVGAVSGTELRENLGADSAPALNAPDMLRIDTIFAGAREDPR